MDIINVSSHLLFGFCGRLLHPVFELFDSSFGDPIVDSGGVWVFSLDEHFQLHCLNWDVLRRLGHHAVDEFLSLKGSV